MNSQPTKNASFSYSALIGTILTASGLVVLFAVLTRVRALFDTPEAFKSFLVLVPQDPVARTITVGGESIIMPDAAFYYMSFALGISLLLVATLVGGMLLRRGISLL